MAVFVNEGEVADVFEPGTYELETANLPLISSLQSWKHGFESPFKAEVYSRRYHALPQSEMGNEEPCDAARSGIWPSALRAFYTYEIRVLDAVALITELVGTDGHFTIGEISNQLRNEIVSRFAGRCGGGAHPCAGFGGKL